MDSVKKTSPTEFDRPMPDFISKKFCKSLRSYGYASRSKAGIGAIIIGQSFDPSTENGRFAIAIRKPNVGHNAAFPILSLRLKAHWNFSGVVCVNSL